MVQRYNIIDGPGELDMVISFTRGGIIFFAIMDAREFTSKREYSTRTIRGRIVSMGLCDGQLQAGTFESRMTESWPLDIKVQLSSGRVVSGRYSPKKRDGTIDI